MHQESLKIVLNLQIIFYNGVCNEVCPDGTYIDILRKECIDCELKCKKCDVDKCLENKSEFIINEGVYTNKYGEGKGNENDICEGYEESGCKVSSSNIKICYDFSCIIFEKKIEKNI